MRQVPAPLQDALSSGVTTLCRCWRVVRADGVTLGFTDHDEDLMLDATVCRAGSGLDASEATARFGLQVDGGEVFGALADDALTEADLAAGRYDAATIETWLVDWSAPSTRLLLAVATLGEVRREGTAFAAELRSLAEKLGQESGRVYTAACTADLGDACCRVNLAAASVTASGTVASLDATSTVRVAGLTGFAQGWFTAGRLAFTSGANAGLASEVKRHVADAAGVAIALWQAMPDPIAPGDTFVITAGCDKQFATCRDRFGNADNFRGFPHIPGNDYVISHA